MHSNFFLIGPPGVGKTAVGRQLARQLGRLFYDSDHEIECQTGVSIGEIFDIEGEAGFRKRESSAIDKLSQYDAIVLSLGGGAVLMPRNREILRDRGTIIYLRASLETQLTRVSHRKNARPLLNAADLRQKVIALNEQRTSLYQSMADYIYDTDVDSPRDISMNIMRALR